MNVDQLIPILDDARLAANWLGGIGIENVERGHGNLVGMAEVTLLD